jgi:endonuclease YncB( thermonuclease family)
MLSHQGGAGKARPPAAAGISPPAPPTNDATAAAGTPREPADADSAGAKQAEQKTHLLAREQADADRSAALQEKGHAATPKPPETKLYFKVKVRDAGTLEADVPRSPKVVVIRIDGVAARGAGESCKRDDGTNWPCGTQARGALIHLIRTRAVTCTLPPGGEVPEFAARCSVMGQDLSAWLVRQGWATPKDGAEPALGEALKAAKTERLGLWSGG